MKHLLCFGLGLLIVLSFCTNAGAGKSTFIVNFEPSNLIFEKVDGFDQIQMKGGISFGEPGSPLLPMKAVQIAIPIDVEVERAEIISSQHQEISGTYNIYPAQPPVPIGIQPMGLEKQEFVPPNSKIYDLAAEYPGKLVEVTNNGFLAGQHIAGFLIYPVQYTPSEKKLIFYTEIEFRLVFKPSSHYPTPVTVRSEKTANFYADMAKKTVLNPQDISFEAKGFLPKDQMVDFLIITADSFVTAFQELADWRNSQGISTEIKDVNWVYSNYAGVDSQEQMRNCIRDYYANHGTMWVLLGGDTPILPHRMAQVGVDDIPCDLYFSDLDSNWDANGNHVYGEYADSIDMYPDVFVGRAPSSTIAQAQIFVSKSLAYETNPPDSHLRRILLCAMLDFEGTKENIDRDFIPPFYEVTKLYDISVNWDRTHFEDALNRGQNIINHCGHGSYDRFVLKNWAERWLNWDMDALINGPNYSLLYSIGCMTAGIDQDCIAEHFINNPQGGGISYIGNSRYGFVGFSDNFDKEFFRVLFDSSSLQVGMTLADSKISFIPIAKYNFYYRYIMFTLLLLGDPTLTIRLYYPDGPVVVYHSHEVSDSAGNNNGAVNPGDRISMSITVKNVGINTAHNVMGTLRTSDGFVTITDSVKYFGEIDTGSTAVSQGSYLFEVDPSCPDSYGVVFNLEANGGSVWTSTFTQMVVQPDFVISASPSFKTIRRGDSTSFSLLFSPLGGFIWPVDLSLSDLPDNISGVFYPPQIIPPGTSILKIYTTSDADTGTHIITITASGSLVVHQKDVSLRIDPRPNVGLVFHVSSTGSDTLGDGSPVNPFRTIQKGISTAWWDDDTVLVEKGKYQENLDFSGKNIMLASHYIFDGMESTIESTIIDGRDDEDMPAVSFGMGENSTAILCGFTIINGGYNGAVHCGNSGPTITHNIFVNNCSTYPSQAAIKCDNSWARITRNLIHGNWGIGISFVMWNDVQVTNNTICYNKKGGIVVIMPNESIPVIKNNIVAYNGVFGIYTGLEGQNSYFGYNDVWANSANYSGLPNQTGINGNISVDPFFTSPVKGNYHLFPISPCINAGDPNDSVPPGGEPRVDMGAFEHTTFYGPISSDRTWEKTIHIVGDVTVESDATLTILPNTTIVFDSTDISHSGVDTSMCEMIVEGSLRAVGTRSDSITFMSLDTSEHPTVVVSSKGEFVEKSPDLSPRSRLNAGATSNNSRIIASSKEEIVKESFDPSPILKSDVDEASANLVLPIEWDTTGAWYGIRVLPGGSTRFDYATIVDVCAGITLNNSAYDTISNCLLWNNQVGINCRNGHSLITKNRICYTPIGSVAIYLNNINNSLSLKDNLLENYRTHIYATNCSTTIEGNKLLGCDYGNVIGIHCTNSKYFKVKSTQIARRRFLECYIKADSSTIRIENCRLEGTWWQMTPTGILTHDCDGSIRGTKITNYGDTGIVAHDSRVMPGYLDFGTDSSQGYNSIYSDSSLVVINNQTGRTIMAQYNWWGTTNPSPSLFIGDVQYVPYLTEPPHSIYDFDNCVKPVVSTKIPEEFQLFQNYPNPFNPETQISYDLPFDSRVKITIFNILGQKVKVLVDKLEATGNKTVMWDGTNENGVRVGSGIYFYKLEAGDFTATKKMVLLR